MTHVEEEEEEHVTPTSVTRMRRIVSHLAQKSSHSVPLSHSNSNLNGKTRWNGWGYDDTRLFINADGHVEITGTRYSDVFHHASSRVLPLLRPWAEKVIGLNVEHTLFAVHQNPQTLVPPQESILSDASRLLLDEFIELITQQCNHKDNHSPRPLRSSRSLEDRVHHSHGQTCEEIYQLRMANPSPKRLPDLILWPSCHQHVVLIVALASSPRFQSSICLIPQGGGTNVTNALECTLDESRAIISLDMTTMKRLLWVDVENQLIRVEAGMTGYELQEKLRHRHLTLGHEPDSWEFSTVGGWIATRASGMKKNVYGNIEDMVINIRMVTPKGTLERSTNVPRVSMGPDIQQTMIGSEGILGVVTEVTFRVRPYPESQRYESLLFPTFRDGLAAMHAIVQAKTVPASIRLLDNVQFQLGQALKPTQSTTKRAQYAAVVTDAAKKWYITSYHGFDPTQMCAATVLMEGTHAQVAQQHQAIQTITTKHGGIIGGAENGRRGYVFTYLIAYLRDFAMDYYFLSESFETSVPWTQVEPLIAEIKQSIHQTVAADGLLTPPLIACRVTQLYETGVTVYVYYGINYYGINDPIALFRRVEKAAVNAIISNGGSLSHHHGIGKHRREWLEEAVSTPAIIALRGLKQALDPSNVFATENLLLTPSKEE